MGSRQSSLADQGVGSISIDPSGKITRKSEQPALNSKYNAENASKDDTVAQTAPVVVQPNVRDEISLKQADEMVTKLKSQYKPESAQMAGKHRSIFEEVERNVVQCYKTNKSQPSKCSKVVQEYQDYVQTQRNQILKNPSYSTIITTILVILTCLLLHISTIHCYGAMSIDLGSEWMKVGLVAPSVQMDIVLNAQSQRKTAMAIAFSNNERFIGDTAMDIASKYPEKTFTHFLDLVGKTVNDESVKHYKKRFPHADITSHEPNSTSIILNHPEGLNFTPLELIAMMLQHAHDQVANRLNSNEPAYDVVITVPPFFNAKEKKVIQDAAKIVGLNVLRLTNVNSAFALSYGIFRHKDYLPELNDNKTSILFLDQGASHTSVTLADYHLVDQVNDAGGLIKNETLPTVTIRAQVYDRFLGGFDMQLKLRDYLVEEFCKKAKIDKSRIYKRGRSSAKLLKESGRVKKILSANTNHLVRVENVIDDKDLKHPISRQEYEDLNLEYLDKRIRNLLDRLFEMPDVSKDEPITSVIIVGGNTRTPKIQQVLLDYFKLDVLGKSINADEGAALAALYQAASLGRGFRVKKFVLEEFGQERKRFDPLMTTTTQAPVEETPSPEAGDSSTEATTSSTTQAPSVSVKVIDPNSIYSEKELDRIKRKLSHLKDQDFTRMQRLSLRNSLESLLSEGREKLSEEVIDEQFKENKEAVEKTIHETYAWLEDGEQHETDNVTILAEKYTLIYELIHPKPPTTPAPPPPKFDESIDLSKVFNNETLNILNMMNLTNPFASPSAQESGEDEMNVTDTNVIGGASTDSSHSSQQTSTEAPEATLGPPHSEL